MSVSSVIKINFRGGIISPGELLAILSVVEKYGVRNLRFGLRQQLLFDVDRDAASGICSLLDAQNRDVEMDADEHPNLVSSYPAEEIFITKTWLSEGIYKDIFDLMDYRPRLKINLSDSNQSFTPLLTGNINWVASPDQMHYWYLFIRFPKTNTIFEWDHLVYTNDIARISQHVEELILSDRTSFYDNPQADGKGLMEQLRMKTKYILKPAEKPAILPQFNLPYYEGINRYNNQFWIGIYRRDELYALDFLKEVCELCLRTKIGQLCSTPWKTIIVKGIAENDRPLWNALLVQYRVNMRHAANELNFQVEDNEASALNLKKHLVTKFNREDTRTFGLCIGIKTRKKSEIFSSILIKRKPLFRFPGLNRLYVYDILCAKDFNPNERTGFVFSSNIPRFLLAEQIRRAILLFGQEAQTRMQSSASNSRNTDLSSHKKTEWYYQCSHCLSVYDEQAGEEVSGIPPGTAFDALPATYSCSVCDSDAGAFTKIEKESLLAPQAE